MARPRKIVDEQLIIEHAAIGYTLEELAALTGVSVDTLGRRYAEVIKRGVSLRNASLRRKQFSLALEGNPTMLVWLGKQYLGQKDKTEFSGDDLGKLGYGNLVPDSAELGNTDKPNGPATRVH